MHTKIVDPVFKATLCFSPALCLTLLLPRLSWRGDNAKLLQHPKCALLEPVLDALTARDNETLIKCYQEASCSTT